MMRKEYTMKQIDFDTLMDACKPVKMIMLQCGTPSCPQENTNRAWDRLGDQMGFDGSTVQPAGSNPLKFTAIPKE